MLLAQLKKIFGEEPLPRGVLEDREPFELATAALLLELARSDFSEHETEVEAVRHLLQKRFELTDDALDVLMANAARRADKAVSLHELTHRLNRELPEEDKLAIVEMLWQVSHADGRIDPHEEHLIRRIAGLLHISDRDRVRLKLKVVVDR
ncbi:TerB family tellurite resistance protein [Steroidobacter sp. S1-65]|uniref:TerB family tellurite resistance protein n=1 Tax=Steroidobacter gossypii TaxID=2805490 RepID=A0ABS1X316_9GAMM|nr:TerB family tellurite resistance protein [Steroidobacter gossypii]MBM0107611.1 TerB family tellurite resistance protein [Steroidobacter gossypii]